MAAEKYIELNSGDWRLLVDPARGGQILKCQWRGHHIFTPARRGSWPIDQAAGCFPLVPYSNRIREAQFRFSEWTVVLPAPDFAMPHALHGLGWRRPWSCQQITSRDIAMVQHNVGGAWPWPYEASQQISISDSSLMLTLSIRNTGIEPMPAGIGMHPYFPKHPDMLVSLCAGGYWTTHPSSPGIPINWYPLDPKKDLFMDTPPSAVDLDNCFTEWGGHIRLDYPGERYRIDISASEAFSNLVIFCPRDRELLCLEPVSHVNDALHLAELHQLQRMDVLGRGESLVGRVVLDVSEGG